MIARPKTYLRQNPDVKSRPWRIHPGGERVRRLVERDTRTKVFWDRPVGRAVNRVDVAARFLNHTLLERPLAVRPHRENAARLACPKIVPANLLLIVLPANPATQLEHFAAARADRSQHVKVRVRVGQVKSILAVQLLCDLYPRGGLRGHSKVREMHRPDGNGAASGLAVEILDVVP
jgi:hypothetical protein